jgi:hypothetical protein
LLLEPSKLLERRDLVGCISFSTDCCSNGRLGFGCDLDGSLESFIFLLLYLSKSKQTQLRFFLDGRWAPTTISELQSEGAYRLCSSAFSSLRRMHYLDTLQIGDFPVWVDHFCFNSHLIGPLGRLLICVLRSELGCARQKQRLLVL